MIWGLVYSFWSCSVKVLQITFFVCTLYSIAVIVPQRSESRFALTSLDLQMSCATSRRSSRPSARSSTRRSPRCPDTKLELPPPPNLSHHYKNTTPKTPPPKHTKQDLLCKHFLPIYYYKQHPPHHVSSSIIQVEMSSRGINNVLLKMCVVKKKLPFLYAGLFCL